MRLLVCAGGTGGGVYPALAVLQALQAEIQGEQNRELAAGLGLQVLWVGGAGGMEADLVKRAGIDYTDIPAAGVHGVGMRALPGNALAILRGYFAARDILQRYQPQALFFTGGYVAVPMALAGRKIPSALYVPDIEPGLALKSLARFASRIAVSAEDSRAYFSHRAQLTVTGYPVRADLARWDRLSALAALRLSPDLPTLLVFGGSKGSHSINIALMAVLPELLTEMQVVHVSGTLDWPVVQANQAALEPSLAAGRYRPYPYLHAEMGAAFSVADLAVCRAGASTLGELPAFGLPAILAPYPHAWRYQYVNAEYLARQGAARILPDRDLGSGLLPLVRLLMSDQEALRGMRQAMRSLARPQAASAIAGLLRSLAGAAHATSLETGNQPKG